MKKIIFTAALFLGLSQLGNAQNTFTVKLGDDVCLGQLELQYSTTSKEVFELGCAGVYQFDIGQNTVDEVQVDGVICKEGKSEITVNGQALRSINDSKRGILGIIK